MTDEDHDPPYLVRRELDADTFIKFNMWASGVVTLSAIIGHNADAYCDGATPEVLCTCNEESDEDAAPAPHPVGPWEPPDLPTVAGTKVILVINTNTDTDTD